MFGMGGTEILVILVVAMIFLGPEKLPEAAAKISKGIRDIRKQQRELTQTIENDTELGGAIRDLKSALRGDDIRRPPVRKPPPAEAPVAESLPAPDAAEAAPGSGAALAEAAARAEEPATMPSAEGAEAEAGTGAEAAPDADADDPMKLIRPATGTAKREHG